MTIMTRLTGVVKWFSKEKGYGFIAKDDGTGDLFVHHSAIDGKGFKNLNEGDEVEFAVAPGKDGKEPKADGVKVLRSAT
jgi:CspA family cold shock protein